MDEWMGKHGPIPVILERIKSGSINISIVALFVAHIGKVVLLT
jgi:hypothetical protein